MEEGVDGGKSKLRRVVGGFGGLVVSMLASVTQVRGLRYMYSRVIPCQVNQIFSIQIPE
jgi:hypothetical protein